MGFVRDTGGVERAVMPLDAVQKIDENVDFFRRILAAANQRCFPVQQGAVVLATLGATVQIIKVEAGENG